MRPISFFVALLTLAGSVLGGCSTPQDPMQQPPLSAVGSGLDASACAGESCTASSPVLRNPGGPPPWPISLYSDQRIARVGDIVTVMIDINDKATFGDSSARSRSSQIGVNGSYSYGSTSAPTTNVTGSLNVSSAAQGQGNIDRAEQIQVSVPAVVEEVLPNGNLVIRGSQEVRVNFEIRHIGVAGIVSPSDIGRNNTIAFARVAEARIAYGGRGRLTDVQQPNWGQQVFDAIAPF